MQDNTKTAESCDAEDITHSDQTLFVGGMSKNTGESNFYLLIKKARLLSILSHMEEFLKLN